MKQFFYLSIVAVSVAMLLTLGPNLSLTANDPAIGSVEQPIKVLDVKLNTSKSQSDESSTQKVSWLEGLEVQIENVSGKPIQYLMLHIEVPAASSAGNFVNVPIGYGQAPIPGSKSGKFEVFQPGAKLTLKASQNSCKRIRDQFLANGVVPSLKDIRANLHLVVFQDRTAWLAGRLHYPDPSDSMHWIAAEELARRGSSFNLPSGMTFSKASYKGDSNPLCYRNTGFHLIVCCTDDTGTYLAGSVNFAVDPNGQVHPNTVVTCCPQDPDACCSYDEIAGGCA